MFVIVTYDMGTKRVGKALRICRRYLSHEQKSVFEGMITEAKLLQLKKELRKLVKPEEDSVNIYRLESLRYASKEKIGQNNYEDNIL